jgi:hypothetical protein
LEKIVMSKVCVVIASLVAGWAAVASAEVILIGTAEIPGTTADRSGLIEMLNESIPANRFGGISALEHLGGDEYLALPDRGPLDGAVPFACRVQRMKIQVRPAATPAVTAEILATTMLQDESGRPLTGAKAAIDTQHPERSLRFDPEGIRARGSRWFISDEYGPDVREFSATGQLVRRFQLPSRLTIAHPNADPLAENAANQTGRQANGGLEGLAISPNGERLFAIMQRPLLQDSAPSENGKRRGRFNRLLEINIANGATREFVYPMTDSSHGVSEILAMNAHEFLVIERDSQEGLAAKCKQVFRIDVRDATEVSRVETLPTDELPTEIRPVQKRLFVDLLDPRFGLAGAHSPEKVEGLAFGPPLPDGRRLLVIAVDNDFRPDRPVLFHAFAFDAE